MMTIESNTLEFHYAQPPHFAIDNSKNIVFVSKTAINIGIANAFDKFIEVSSHPQSANDFAH